ncbi:hypothetical protein CROQUDRAFT_98820 [Cronartium quercuum f. sp. fusiforme G11]|uniref:Uncharacterized protein n=1 Tax=Cronartium quercuum f. sp. fusiforme G11 TaxID=708437 RepID=A0A9P6T7C9_9BASI|nr:hypothetical protein CROQUDRAFT_98820 [Cronartium quercuum f. sp. fusiforme G11]
MSGSPDEIAAAKDLPYQQIVGLSQLSRFGNAWTNSHWTLAKHVLRYLKGTPHIAITF